MKQLEQQIKAINKSLQSQNELMQKRTDELEAMLKELKAKNAELSQNLASLQKDYHEIVKSLTSSQSKDNTAAQQSQSQQPAQPTQMPQPRVSRVKDILAGNVKSVRDSHTPSQTQITAQGDITSFSNNDLGNVRIAMQDNEPMFCLSDIAKVLDFRDGNNLKNSIDSEFDKGGIFNMYPLESISGIQNYIFISEPELYFVLMRSRSNKAKPFRQWVVNEVLPSIRKSGSYQVDSAQQKEVFNLIYETPCRDAILKVVRDSEVQHNAKAKGIKEYTITEKMKRGKVYTNCQVGIEWDKYIPPTKPISKLRKAR